MKTLFVLLIFTASIYSQKIEKEIDDFTGDTIYTMKFSNLSGGSFWGMQNANLSLNYVSGKTLFMHLMVTNNKIFSVKPGILGASLMIKTSGKLYELSDNGQNTFDAGAQGSGICKVVYIVNFELIRDIIDTPEPKVRVITSDESYIDFHFGDDNIKEYKKFYNKFN